MASLVHPEDTENSKRKFEACIESGAVFDDIHRVVHSNGDTHFIQAIASIIKDSKGQSIRATGLVFDITERRLTEQVNEQRYRTLSSRIPLGVLEQDWSVIKKSVDKLKSEGVENIKDYFDNNSLALRDLVNTIVITNVNDSLLKIYKASSVEELIESEENVLDWWDQYWANIYASEIAALASPTMRSCSELKEIHIDGSAFDIRLITSITEGDDDNWRRVLTIVEDVTDRKKHELELVEANKTKTEFLSRMSHELRTPLNAIIGFAQIQKMKLTENTPKDERTATDHIFEAGQHLLMLVEDILDVTKLEQNKMDIPLTAIDLDTVIGASLNLVKNEATKNHITLNHKQSGISVIANVRRLQQVLTNVLTNAIKYNRESGSVTISTKILEQKLIEVAIGDTGVGIDPQSEESVFSPFSRLTYATKNEIGGTGIGMALSKSMIEQMNGHIGFNSAAEDGTIFWIQLPQGKAVKNDSSQEKELPTAATNIVHTVLYIEDHLPSRELFKMIFTGYPELLLLTAKNAEEGIELAKKSPPGLIFIDINLPGIDGIAALRILQSDPSLAHSRMIALSADALPGQVEKAMQAGFDAYLTKPVEISQIVQVIEAI